MGNTRRNQMSFLQLAMLPTTCLRTQHSMLWKLAQKPGETFCFPLFFCLYAAGWLQDLKATSQKENHNFP